MNEICLNIKLWTQISHPLSPNACSEVFPIDESIASSEDDVPSVAKFVLLTNIAHVK